MTPKDGTSLVSQRWASLLAGVVRDEDERGWWRGAGGCGDQDGGCRQRTGSWERALIGCRLATASPVRGWDAGLRRRPTIIRSDGGPRPPDPAGSGGRGPGPVQRLVPRRCWAGRLRVKKLGLLCSMEFGRPRKGLRTVSGVEVDSVETVEGWSVLIDPDTGEWITSGRGGQHAATQMEKED